MHRVRWGWGDLGITTLNGTVLIDCWVCIVFEDRTNEEEEANWLILVVIDGDDCIPGSLLLDEVDDEEQEVEDADMRRWFRLWPIMGVAEAIIWVK